ncbi:hypothetical protein V8C86DRAFT_2435596 [Haematococcus lacustris]
MCADATCCGARIVTLLLVVGSITRTSSSGSPDACPANSMPLTMICTCPSCRETALPVGSGVDSELQGFLQNKTSELLNNCFPSAGAIKIRQLKVNASDAVDSTTAPAYDAFIIPGSLVGDLAQSGAMVDLQPFITSDAKQVVAWGDLPAYDNLFGSRYSQQVIGVPILESPFLMYVNWPLLTSMYNISRPLLGEFGRLDFYPDTWQELISVMQQVNATASEPVTGKPRHALCMPQGTDIVYLHQAIMASIMQTGGVTQGWLFDPLTLEPLTNNTASEKVLHIMWALSPFLRTFDTAVAIDMSQCAVALAGASIFKSCNPVGSHPQLMGQLGISPLPASTEVLDRSTMQLVPCTPQLCNSQRASVLTGSWANLSPSRYQNIVLLSMSTLVPQELRSAVYDLIAFLSAPTGPLAMLWAPVSTYAPFRSSGRLAYQVGDPWDQPGLSMWSTYGYNYTDVKAYDKALTTILTLPGTAMEWRVADSQYPLYFIYDALNSLLGNEVAHTKVPYGCLVVQVPRSAGRPTDFAAAMDAMTTSLRVVRDNLGAAAFREQLWGTTGFVPPAQPPQPAPPSPPPAGSPGLTTPVLVTVIAVPVAVCSLLVLLLAVIITHLRRNAKLQRSLMGHVLPPAAGDKATLVITDVQGSSKLWETMPAEVMDVSMKLHDELVRRLALDSSGYEWATEGDSFLLCFHSPQAAVAFSTQLQDALLRCSQWPVELAAEGSPSQPLCLAPVWPGSRATGTSGSYTNASNQPLSRLVLTAASATQSASQLPSSTKPNQQLLMGSEAVQGPCSASQVGWQRLCELYQEVEAAMPAALTVVAGLRVRVGLHTGLAADEVLVQRRMGASSITYGGAALVLAKAVQACAHGGQVTLSAATFVKLPVEELRAAGISVVHMGQHLVALGEGKGARALELYCACLNTPDHAHRLWALGPLRTLRQVQPGVLHSPYGTAAIAFMSVVGLSHLKAWNAELAKECVALYQAAAQRLLLHVSGPQLPAGYWVSSAEEEGMVLAAFPCSLQCLHWALLTLTTCMDMDWPQVLLDSLFGEEMTACLDTSGSKAGVTQAPATGDDEGQQQRAAAQGTVGVDVGEVACDLTPANGRFNYRGRCLNRAARINSLAASGQVWCSETAWANTLAALQPIITTKEARALASLAADQPAGSTASWSAQGSKQGQPLCLPGLLPPLVARPLGKRELRGIPGQVALLQAVRPPRSVLLTSLGSNWLPVKEGAPPSPPRSSPLPDDPETLDVWILAGQSNMVGENAFDGTDYSRMGPDCVQPRPGRLLMFPLATRAWTDAQPCVGCISNGCTGSTCGLTLGPDIAFGNGILAANLSYRVGFVPAAIGSTSLKLSWSPGVDRYNAMVNGTWAAMRAAGPAARLRGMLWVQGESDAYYPQDIVAAANYAANLRNFLAAVRKEFASLHPRLPVVVARQAVVNRDTLFPWIRIVRDQQDEVLSDPTQQPLPAVDMEGLEFFNATLPGVIPQWIHLSHLGVCQLGRSMVASYQQSGQQFAELGSQACQEGTGKAHENWWHPAMIQPILQAVPACGGYSPAVKHLKLVQPDLYSKLDESTVRGWYQKGSLTHLTEQAQASLFRGAGHHRVPTAGRRATLGNFLLLKVEIKERLEALREGGVALNHLTARSVMMAVIQQREPQLLASNGGPLHLSAHFVRDFLEHQLNWVTR